MERNLQIMKEILSSVEQENHYSEALKKYPPKDVAYNAQLLIDGGYVVGDVHYSAARTGRAEPVGYHITRLTLTGHDFLDASKDKDVWEKSQERIKKVAGWTLPIVVEVMKDEVKKRLGLP